ncbi:MAG: biotin--[acetyl-CoA-carboxylase] ligase [Coriobacteriales bacterium]|jgi:BirA family biotin operon repressor/biotin-[acetyl-CoA-carboxylase] ligase|nr:biotin--[acetyl-CoA-carboxylase] ligase [Coriobacteriales bacterium]
MTGKFELIRLDSCPSTNEYLKEPLAVGIDRNLPVFVLAKQQTAGLGRLGRGWRSPTGGVYLSLLWPTELTPEQALCLPLITALAARFALQPMTSKNIVIKWPNDLLVIVNNNRQKLAGILVELTGGQAIIGIGVNIYQNKQAPEESDGGRPPAWLAPEQLSQADGEKLVEQAAQAIIESLLEYLKRWHTAGSRFTGFAEEYSLHLDLIGEYVEARDRLGELLAAGIIHGIDNSGQLLIQNEQGITEISSGEVTFRTPL